MWEWGKGNLSLKNSRLQTGHPTGKPPPSDTAEPRSPPAAAPSLAHVEQVTKSDHCLTNLTSNLPQVKNDLHSILNFLYSRIRMNQVEKWTWKCNGKYLSCKMRSYVWGLYAAARLRYCTGCEQVGEEQKESLGTQECVPASLFSLFCSFTRERSACLSAARGLCSGGDAASPRWGSARFPFHGVSLCRGETGILLFVYRKCKETRKWDGVVY